MRMNSAGPSQPLPLTMPNVRQVPSPSLMNTGPPESPEHVVVPSGSCAWMLKTEYPSLLKHDGALRATAESLAARTRELSQFIVEVLGVTRVESRAAR